MLLNPTISVVMVCYNHEKFIKEAIDSILGQTYSDFELIIVDDGSSDSTLKLVKEYDDPRITLIEEENSGPSIAFNTGINKSKGEFIALMSGDDISMQNRLSTQIQQINSVNADMVFSVPQIIGPDSKILPNRICPAFFRRVFTGTAELYSQLFYLGNFLCAPSCFFRRSVIDSVGLFKRGLIQLQDFDYWIRVCKKDLVVKLELEPLVKYRFLFGSNLSDRQNIIRVDIEKMSIYREFFDGVSRETLQNAFWDNLSNKTNLLSQNNEIDKSFLFLDHPDASIKRIGAETIIQQFENDLIYANLLSERNFTPKKFFELTKSKAFGTLSFSRKLKNILILIRNQCLRRLSFLISQENQLTEEQLQQQICYYFDRGDNVKALAVYENHKIQPSLYQKTARIFRICKKIIVSPKTSTKLALEKINNKMKDISSKKIRSIVTLTGAYDYFTKTKCIIFEDQIETINLKIPNVIGSLSVTPSEGETLAPRAYISSIKHATIIGGSNIVITQSKDLLNDELTDFESGDFGVKSPNIVFRRNHHIILNLKEKPNTHIHKGILLSCDHDSNYFHWLVECLPKLILIDDIHKFQDYPILIQAGLHPNLIAALDRVNVYHHPIIAIESGISYHVENLVYPSPLSRVLDRYRGKPAFDTDIVLSPKWIRRVADLLKGDEKNKKKPWRKLYLTRRKGLRALGNQEEIELLMTKSGFEILDLDGVSLDYQTELFSQAAMIIAPTGAALTNMLLCKPGTKVIIFMSNHETTNYYFWSNLGNIVGLDVKIILGDRLNNLTNYYSVHDDYVINPEILLNELTWLN